MATRMRTDDPLEHIMQDNRSSGCGIAYIAMVARKSYDGVRKKIFGYHKRNLYLWYWSDIRYWQRLSQMNDFSIV
jgi:hypothetical protein